MRNASARENHPTREKVTRGGERDFLSPRHVSPFLAWGDFHAHSRFARSTIPEEKWGTTCSLVYRGKSGTPLKYLETDNSNTAQQD